MKQFPARFSESATGKQPVREWLLSLSDEDRKLIGDDIGTAEFGWPVGMSLCRSIKGRNGLWEIRGSLNGNRNARAFFCAYGGDMILLHGFIGNSRTVQGREIDIAAKRMRGLT